MPRTSSRSGNSVAERREERAIKVEKVKVNVWESVRSFFLDRRTRMVAGILLLGFAVVSLLAYVSYLFTGTADESILSMDHAGRIENREAIRNMLGLPGARLAHFLIDGTFGFVSVLLLLMVAVSSILWNFMSSTHTCFWLTAWRDSANRQTPTSWAITSRTLSCRTIMPQNFIARCLTTIMGT